MKRINIAKILSAIATAMGCVALYFSFSGQEAPAFVILSYVLVPLLAIVSYCLCGFFKAICTPFSAAKWGFFIAPFPINLCMVLALFLAGLLSVIYLPAIPVFKRAAELGC